ncbi:MAG TPA: penicillin acylase family protein [Verrucomicrobiota bacterium]|nr:penicillin acylase family protein [Verrucomicrobiota bacterium]HRZ38697.1 penicillin acylase family protein [Candidatus Paceibacterota bacterium]
MKKRLLRWVGAILVVLAVALVGGTVWLWLKVRGSLPDLDGQRRLAGLESAVTIERDALGVPTIRAGSRLDAARATGFLHAQDRFFQMDLMRRAGAGELAELLGPAVLPADRECRRHRLREVARLALARGPAEHRALAEAYADGVNAGLAALGAAPPEYLLLRSTPYSWLAEDSILVGYAMFFTLQESDGAGERSLGVLRELLPAEAFAFFAPIATDWDAAVDGTVLENPSMPSANVFSFESSRQESGSDDAAQAAGDLALERDVVGSNSWAVDGRYSSSGSALVANDMHLGLNVPVIWYRMRIICQPSSSAEKSLDLAGVSLPGSPLIVVGSNGHIAWSFTDAAVDSSDVVLVEVSPDDPTRYRVPQGWRTFEVHRETLRVRGGPSQTLTVTNTIWGPLVPGSAPGQVCALSWVAHFSEAVNMRLADLEQALDAATAMRLAPHCGIPVMNLVVGDRAGEIGWTLCGRLPKRVGFDGRTPVSWADGTHRWEGLLPADDYPRISSAGLERVWTANNRIAGSAAYLATGPWSVDLGARARQIRDGLLQVERAGPADMLKIQLDDRAVFLERWQRLLLATLSRPDVTNRSEVAGMLPHVERWGGRATPDSVGYALVRQFRNQAIHLVLEPVTARCLKGYPGFGYGALQVEQPVWTILEHRPTHLLNPRFATFEALLTRAAELAWRMNRGSTGGRAPRRWGELNRVLIRHPLSQGVPWLSEWLDVPPLELPGDSHMPRVQGRGFGASERLAVSPGHEADGYLHMPGGQSGHPLSPYYRAGYQAWARGEPTPFLPGAARHNLTLIP